LEGEIAERTAAEENLRDSYNELEVTQGKIRTNYEMLQVNKKALQESERRFCLMLENVQLITMMIDNDGKLIFCNDFMMELTGFQRHEVIGEDYFRLFIPSEIRAEIKGKYKTALKNNELWFSSTNNIQTKNGVIHLVNWNNTLLLDHSGNIVGLASIGEDITKRTEMENKLKFQSMHDSLTGLYNRTYFEENLESLENNRSTSVGIVVCDIDGFFEKATEKGIDML